MQSGTSSLRALLYIDEMFGYFPPYPKNPPTKEPLLRLLKQARAFGIGMILATQNPGDLDYKGLSNAGTWFIGRLQTPNDRKKVMNGLESMATADNGLNVNQVEDLISEVEPRVFLMHNIHNDGGPIMLHTRWAMSFLRGPLTRQQVRWLMASQRKEVMKRYRQQLGNYGQQHQVWQQGQGQRGTSSQQQGGNWQAQQQGGYGNQPPPPPGMPGQQQQGGYGNQPPPPPGMPGQQKGQGGYGNQGQFNAQNAPQQQSPTGPIPNEFQPTQPALPSSISQYFLPENLSQTEALQQWEQGANRSAHAAGNARIAYKPVVFGQANVRYQDKKTSLYTARNYAFRIDDLPAAGLLHWEDYAVEPINPREVSGEPLHENALFKEVPATMQNEKRFKTLEKELKDMLYNTANLTLPFNPHLKIYGNPDEDYSVFQSNVMQAAREERDAEVDQLTAKYEKALDSLDDKLRRKIRELDAEKKEIRDRKLEEIFTAGEAAIGLLRGRTHYTLSRASRATRMRRQTTEDLTESEQVILEIEAEIAETEQSFEQELQQINERWAEIANTVEDYLVTPYKKDIHIELFGVAWMPYWLTTIGGQPELLSAR